MAALSARIAEAFKSQRNNRELMKLSTDMKKAMNILKSLKEKAKANRRSASAESLRKLSAAVQVLQNDINKLGPQPEPPDKQ